MKRVDNPPNPYLGVEYEWLEPPPPATIEVYEEIAKSILTENESPDVPFRWSVNPYRGCQHACAYCYARPYHEYLGLGAGTDFETKLVVKTNAAELLDAELLNPNWCRESVIFSGITDCYQPLEAVYKVTQACLRVCLEHRNAVAIVTKSYLVMRDADLLAELNRAAGAKVYQSIPFADDGLARLIEPQAPPPSRRFDAMRKLSRAGVPVGVMVAPIIPGLNDHQIGQVLERAAEAGAVSAGYVPLRLAGSVRPVFLSRLREALPERAARVEARIRDMRGGRLNDPRFHTRMRGEGPYWRSIQELFRVALIRYGLSSLKRPEPTSAAARTPPADSAERAAVTCAPRTAPDTQLSLGFTDAESQI